ncbi:MAG TPA: tetratricopeptide repeat protein [Blastocatellia bacterium]|nr:tetratricopeptide repeat protein [Blastocatellia bacterium]
MRHRSSLIVIVILAVSLPGCLHRRSRATGSLYPVTDVVAGSPNGDVAQSVNPNSPRALSDYVRSVLKISQENTVAAEEALKQLQQRRPDLATLSTRASASAADVDARRLLAEAYLDEGLLPYAFQMYQEIAAIKPRDARAEIGIARVWDKWGDYGLAQQHAESAVLFDPASAQALEVLGRVCLHRNELDQALSAFISAIKIKPQDASLLNNAGYIFLKRNDLLQAKIYLEQAVSIDSSMVEAHNNLGIAFARLGDRERALQEFMVVNDPAAAFNNLGVVYMTQKNWSDAREAFRRAIALDPKQEKAQTNLAEAEAHLPPPTVVDLPASRDTVAVAPIKAKAVKLGPGRNQPAGVVTKKDSRMAAAYRDALGRYNGRRYKEAIDIFQWLLLQYPNEALASNCEYWVGESYFGLGQYKDAYAAFKRVTLYSGSAKRNEALLMMRRAAAKQRQGARSAKG